jgi:Bacteriophage tail sheath protein
MATQLSSNVGIEEEEPKVRPITAVQTSIVCVVGITERGPLGTPTLVTSFDEYDDYFGGYTTTSEVAHAAAGFFENEGQFLYVIRTVHYTDPTATVPSPATAAAATVMLQTAATGPTAGQQTGSLTETFAFVDGDTFVCDVDGAGDVTSTFNAAAAVSTSSLAENYALVNGQTLLFSVDNGPVQTVTFLTAEFVAIGAATALEVAAVINAKATGVQASGATGSVVITSDTVGTDSGIDTFSGTAAATLGFASPAQDSAGTGDAADASAVTVAELKTQIEGDIPALTITAVAGAVNVASNTTGVGSTIAINATSTMDDELGLDNATHTGTTGAAVNTLKVDGKTMGAYANSIQILIADATSAVATEFDLTVLIDGAIENEYPNLSMIDTDDRYVETILTAESNLITATDQDASVSQRPANGTSSLMTGGNDGLVGIVDADYGTAITATVGLHTLDEIQDVNLLIIPGQATSVIQNGMITYCEDFREMSMFAILDAPSGSSYTDVVTYFETTSALLGSSEFGAAYWPWVKVTNPTEAVFGNVTDLTVSPAGHIAGVFARTDASTEGGVYLPPAGIEEGAIKGIVGFETDQVLDKKKRDFVFPKRINILTSFKGAPRHIDGSRTLKANGNFPYVAQRRGAIFIEQSIKNGIEFARNKNNTKKLRRTVERTVRSFLLLQMKNEAFASTDPDEAFFVDFSDKLNPASAVAAGKMYGRVGLAFNTPAEFIIVRFSKDTRKLVEAAAA